MGYILAAFVMVGLWKLVERVEKLEERMDNHVRYHLDLEEKE